MKKIILLISLTLSLNVFAQLSGTYSIGAVNIPGENGNYATLANAITALNSNGVSGPCIFYFTESKTYTEVADLWLGCSGTSSINTITFKPYIGVKDTIYFSRTILHDSTATTGIDGHFVIGSPSGKNSNLVSTNYVTIDGSNTVDGNTKDLTIKGAVTTSQKSIIRIFGNSDHFTIKNCILTLQCTSGSTCAGINVTNFNSSSTNYLPDYLTIQNNTINSISSNGATGIYISFSGTPTAGNTGLTIRDNEITSRQRGIYISYTNDGNVFGNKISEVSQASQASSAVVLTTNFGTVGTFNVYNNQITALTTLNNTSGQSNGVIGIDNQCVVPKIVNIYNNTIAGVGPGSTAATNAKIIGIRLSGTGTSYIYNNSIYFPEMTNMSAYGSSYIAAIAFASLTETSPTGTAIIKNNIIIFNETTMKVCGIRRVGTSGTFVSENNDIFINAVNTAGYVGYYNATDQQTLANWQTASSQDAHSKSIPVSFVSATDMHLSGSSIGDFNLAGTQLTGYTTDIDGETRGAVYPYMGADENTTIPLEPYKRNVDGDGSDWLGTASSTVHATVESSEEAIYTGEIGDARTDQHGGDANGEQNNDITDFRITRDDNYLYMRFTLADIIDINRPYIAITIDKDQADNTPLWVGDDSPVSLSTVTDGPSTNRGWERQIAIHAVSNGVLDIELFADDGSNWYAPLSNHSVVGSVSNNIIEARIALVDLGLTTTSNLRMSVGTFNNNVGYNNIVDATTGSYIDVVTPGYSGTANAWFRAGADNASWSSNVQWDQGLTTLPVELTSFTSSVKSNSVYLNWNTATEVNNYGFNVERSSDKTNWTKIGFVNGNGNSNSPKNYSYVDKSALSGTQYYRLKQVDTDGKYEYSKIVEVKLALPKTYELSNNYPNPFNPSTTIKYALPESQIVKLTIYNTLGEEVARLVNGYMEAGIHEVKFNAGSLSSGVYIYRIEAGKFMQTKKMMLIK